MHRLKNTERSFPLHWNRVFSKDVRNYLLKVLFMIAAIFRKHSHSWTQKSQNRTIFFKRVVIFDRSDQYLLPSWNFKLHYIVLYEIEKLLYNISSIKYKKWQKKINNKIQTQFIIFFVKVSYSISYCIQLKFIEYLIVIVVNHRGFEIPPFSHIIIFSKILLPKYLFPEH